MYMPWDCRNGLPPGVHGARLRRVLSAIARPHGWRTNGGADIGGYPGAQRGASPWPRPYWLTHTHPYAACGTSMDWAFTHCGVPLSFTAEVFGGEGSPQDCFRFFNPADTSTLQATTSRWSAALLRAAALAVAEFRGVEVARGVPPLGPAASLGTAPRSAGDTQALAGLAPPRFLLAALACWAPAEPCSSPLAVHHALCRRLRPDARHTPGAHVALIVPRSEDPASEWAASVASAAVLAVAVQAASLSGRAWRGPEECAGAALAAVQALAVTPGPGEASLPQAARRVAPLVDTLSLVVGEASQLPEAGGGRRLTLHVRAAAPGNGSVDPTRGHRGSSGAWVGRERGGFALRASGLLPADTPGCADPGAPFPPISFPSRHSDGRWHAPRECAWGGCACVGCDGRERCSRWAGSVPPRETLVRETAEAASRVLAGLAEALETRAGEDGAEGGEARWGQSAREPGLRRRPWAREAGHREQSAGAPPARPGSSAGTVKAVLPPLTPSHPVQAPARDVSNVLQVRLLHSVGLLVVFCIWRALRR